MHDIAEALHQYVPPDKPVLFLCIGTDRSTGDAYGPLVGTELKRFGVPVLGTIQDPVHALNLETVRIVLRSLYPDHAVIAIDACLGRLEDVGDVHVHPGPLRPGAGVKKDLGEIGDVSIKGIVNASGFLGYFVLQDTRLYAVLEMVRHTVDGVTEFWWTREQVVQGVAVTDAAAE